MSIDRTVPLRSRVRGGTGNDRLGSGGGPDELDGGTGRDRVSYAGRTDAVVVTLIGGADDGAPGEGDNLIAIESLAGSRGYDVLVGGLAGERIEGGSGDDQIDGGPGHDTLVGGTGRDALAGADGNDVFLASRGTDGADVMNGGPGVDRMDYSARTRGVAADADGRADDGARPGGPIRFTDPLPSLATYWAYEDDLVQPDVETLRGTALEDVLGASPAGGRLEGLAGTDVLSGLGGLDTFDGGPGFDRILSRDLRADRIGCGTEVDRVHADFSDRPSLDCESVLTSFAVALTPLVRTLTPESTLPVRVACPPQAHVRCVGAVRAVTVRRLRNADGRLRTRVLGAARFNVPSGTGLDVTLTVDEAGRRVLEQLGGATRVRLAARGRDDAGPARPVAARFILRTP